MTARVDSFSAVFGAALRGVPCRVVGLDAEARPLPVADWSRAVDDADRQLLELCTGPTIDIGCGPGRLAAGLAAEGRIVLGIDVVEEAVAQTRLRGAAALLRDVFEPLPGEGRWGTALLADGNVGIGGDPVALLRRVRDLLDPRGRVVVELAAPGVEGRVVRARLEGPGVVSRPFRWAVVSIDDIDEAARHAGLDVVHRTEFAGRWCAVLEERP